jgi:hypothetical protein
MRRIAVVLKMLPVRPLTSTDVVVMLGEDTSCMGASWEPTADAGGLDTVILSLLKAARK